MELSFYSNFKENCYDVIASYESVVLYTASHDNKYIWNIDVLESNNVDEFVKELNSHLRLEHKMFNTDTDFAELTIKPKEAV